MKRMFAGKRDEAILAVGVLRQSSNWKVKNLLGEGGTGNSTSPAHKFDLLEICPLCL